MSVKPLLIKFAPDYTPKFYSFRFICSETVEEKILQIQNRKLAIARNALEGDKTFDFKLTIEDMKQMFGISSLLQEKT